MSLNVLLIESKGVKRKGTEVPGGWCYFSFPFFVFSIPPSATSLAPEDTAEYTAYPITATLASASAAYKCLVGIAAKHSKALTTLGLASRLSTVGATLGCLSIEEKSPLLYAAKAPSSRATKAKVQYGVTLPFLFSSLLSFSSPPLEWVFFPPGLEVLPGSFRGGTEIILLCSASNCVPTFLIRGLQYWRHGLVYSLLSFTPNSLSLAIRKAALVIIPASQYVGKMFSPTLMKANSWGFSLVLYVGMGALPKESERFVLSQFFISVVIEEICSSERMISVLNASKLIFITIFYPYINFYAAILLHNAKIHKNKVVYINKLDEDSTFVLRSRPGIKLCP
jgi:hypothetical protein